MLPPMAEEAKEDLARRLYEEIETVYPGPEPEMIPWGALSEDRKIYFRTCVETLLDDKDLLLSALGSLR
jgi:hypothetical protein